MKRLFACALTALLAVMLLAAPAYAALEAGTGSGFYAVDDAGVLSAQTEEKLAEYNAVLENECSGAQLVVATVSYLDEDADIYATRLMNSWGVGSDNGVLLLLVTACVLGILGALVTRARGRAFPFGPYIALAALLTRLAGENVVAWYAGLF